ncbi:MAG: hypothetical protein H0V39_03530, partial [Nitrosomonas sp.]|nr:hypothetical protein [Nitrosomonas sp.]
MRPSLFLKIFAAFLTANLLAMTLAVYYLMPPSESKEFYEIRKEFSLNMAKTIIGRFESNKPLNIFQSDLYGLNRPMRSRFLTEKFVILDERNKIIFGEQNLPTDDQHSFLDYQSDSSRQYRIVIGDSREPSVLNYFIKQRQTVRFAI